MTVGYEKVKKYQNKQRAMGLCVVGCKRPLKTKNHCDICAKAAASRNNFKRNRKRLTLIQQGLCSNDCGRKLVMKWFCRECQDKINVYARNSWQKNIIQRRKTNLKKMHKYRFGGLRDIVMQRDNHACQICLRKHTIVVHHIDENPKNNVIENLICVCNICHMVIERFNRTRPNLKKIFYWFSP